jgi:hypothetical protein
MFRAATIATFIYAVITYHRLTKYEDYHLTANAKAQGGYVPGGESHELGHNRASYYAHNYPRTDTEQGITATTTTALPRYSDTSYPTQTQPQAQSQSYVQPYHKSAPLPDPGTHPALAPSPSTADLKRQVDQAMGYEFGWGSRPADIHNGSSHDSTATATATDPVNRSGSVVLGSGTVPVRHGMVARPALGVARQQSWYVLSFFLPCLFSLFLLFPSSSFSFSSFLFFSFILFSFILFSFFLFFYVFLSLLSAHTHMHTPPFTPNSIIGL